VSEKPSLHDIAAMPYPASLEAMRKHYNPDWGKPVPDGETLRTFKVRIEYSYRCDGDGVATVNAFTEEEAIDAAFEEVTKGLPAFADVELEDHEIVTVSEPLS
jgi:hypothetical protein